MLTTTAVLIKDFYKKSDDPENHEEYADFFTPNATLIMGLKTFHGRDGIHLCLFPNVDVLALLGIVLMVEILQFREGTWKEVKARHHTVTDTYLKSNDDLMLMGTVDYELKNGRKLKVQWAGRMYLVEGKISFYQVYLDGSAMLVASGKTIRGDENGQMLVE